MVNIINVYFEPFLDIKLNLHVKSAMMEYVIEKFGYTENTFLKINSSGNIAYFIWKDKETLIFIKEPFLSETEDYNTYPVYHW